MRRVVALLVALLALAASSSAVAAEPRASFNDIEDEVMCDTCNVPLNIAEGSALTRKSAQHSYRIALGSTREVEAALRTAECLGFLGAADIAEAVALCDRLRAMLWRLTR